jgi:hypothetical protein
MSLSRSSSSSSTNTSSSTSAEDMRTIVIQSDSTPSQISKSSNPADDFISSFTKPLMSFNDINNLLNQGLIRFIYYFIPTNSIFGRTKKDVEDDMIQIQKHIMLANAEKNFNASGSLLVTSSYQDYFPLSLNDKEMMVKFALHNSMNKIPLEKVQEFFGHVFIIDFIRNVNSNFRYKKILADKTEDHFEALTYAIFEFITSVTHSYQAQQKLMSVKNPKNEMETFRSSFDQQITTSLASIRALITDIINLKTETSELPSLIEAVNHIYQPIQMANKNFISLEAYEKIKLQKDNIFSLETEIDHLNTKLNELKNNLAEQEDINQSLTNEINESHKYVMELQARIIEANSEIELKKTEIETWIASFKQHEDYWKLTNESNESIIAELRKTIESNIHQVQTLPAKSTSSDAATMTEEEKSVDNNGIIALEHIDNHEKKINRPLRHVSRYVISFAANSSAALISTLIIVNVIALAAIPVVGWGLLAGAATMLAMMSAYKAISNYVKNRKNITSIISIQPDINRPNNSTNGIIQSLMSHERVNYRAPIAEVKRENTEVEDVIASAANAALIASHLESRNKVHQVIEEVRIQSLEEDRTQRPNLF